MIGACVLFAVMATSVALAHARSPGLSTFVSSAVRSATNLLLLVAMARGDVRALLGDARPALWVRGFSGGAALITYFAAIEHLSVGEASFLNQTSAVWVVAAAPWTIGERPGLLAWIAVLGSMGGVALLAHPRPGEADAVGRALGLLSGLCAAGAYLSIRKAAASNRPAVIVFYFTLVSTIASFALIAATGAALPTDPITWAWLVLAGAAATWAQLVMTEAYRVGNTAAVAAAGAAGPLFTTIGGWLLLGQVPDAAGAVGMAILLVSSVVMPFYAR